MKKWVLFDDCGTDFFTDVLNVETEDEAVRKAYDMYVFMLMPRDRMRRRAFYVGLADVDDDGIVDFDTIENQTIIALG